MKLNVIVSKEILLLRPLVRGTLVNSRTCQPDRCREGVWPRQNDELRIRLFCRVAPSLVIYNTFVACATQMLPFIVLPAPFLRSSEIRESYSVFQRSLAPATRIETRFS